VGRTAEPAGDIDQVAGAGAIAPQGCSAGHGSANHDVTGEDLPSAQVAARQWSSRSVGKAQQATVEAIDPSRSDAPGQGEGEQAEARLPAHGGDIAQSAGEGFVTDRFGAVRVQPEMNVFNQQVSGEQEIVAGAAGPEDAAIVTDSEDQAGAARESDAAAELVQNILLASQQAILPPGDWFQPPVIEGDYLYRICG
jgi:hypothetical protein